MPLNLSQKIGEQRFKKLEASLASWTDFYNSTRVEPPSAADYEEFLAVEAQGRKRLYFANRLLGMYHTALREENTKLLTTALAK